MNNIPMIISLFLLLSFALWTACEKRNDDASFGDGVYRGIFMDGGVQEVGIEFTLRNHIVTDIRFRHLFHDNINYIEGTDPKITHLRKQHEQLIGHLTRKDIRTALRDLYLPGNIVPTTGDSIDGLSGATLRSGKVISAVRDGLNRGVYQRVEPKR